MPTILAQLSSSKVNRDIQAAGAASLIPLPQTFTTKSGRLIIDSNATIAINNTQNEALYLQRAIFQAYGLTLPIVSTANVDDATIVLTLDGDSARLGVEGYCLTSTPNSVTIEAAGNAGIFYGIQTLLQLLPTADDIAIGTGEPSIPCGLIEDWPRFSWRGAMLDVARFFMPLDFIRRFIDLMAMHKLNTLHLHLTDDQGWRVEIKKYPRLTEVGAYRAETLVGNYEDTKDSPRFDGTPHGGYYTQGELRELVRYAAERHVTLVPEIEMPGHACAAIAAYPELGNTGKPLAVGTNWGVYKDIFNAEESTIEFLQEVLVEVMNIFPSRYIHVGGDEAIKTQWQESARTQERIRELGLKNESELQAYFIGRMDQFLTAHGRVLVGWDEIIDGGLAANATVMSWHSERGGIEASTAGHDVVMAPVHYTYFDLRQAENIDDEPLAQDGYVPLEKVYLYDPIPNGLPIDAVGHILGAQGQLWTEYIPDPKHLEYMAFPRLCALAEVCWTNAGDRSFPEFAVRLATHLHHLDALDVNYRPLSQ